MSHQLAIEYDVLGVGFGPSNLALAIALDEYAKRSRSKCVPIFIERQPNFTWHGGMLLPDSDMQISFLKDLVSLRDPTSPFTFVNYLHKRGRLLDFSNCRTFYPSRIEFNDYLRWVAGHFKSVVSYGETITAVEPITAGQCVTSLRVHSRKLGGGENVRIARNLVVAVGGTAHIPALFREIAEDSRVLHTSAYLDAIVTAGLEAKRAHVAIIGGGQSAAEVTVDLRSRFPEAHIDLIFRGHALKPSDASPFVNEIFNPEFTDFFYSRDEEQREALVSNFRNTNYAVIDPDLLDKLYRSLYQQRVTGEEGLTLHPRNEVVAAVKTSDGIELDVVDKFDSRAWRRKYDVVILATGYDRSAPHAFLDPIRRYVEGNALDRNYRLVMSPAFQPQIHLQGYSETSHGLSDTLISVLPIRAQEIADSLGLTISSREMIA
jgi:L-ornithine N5-oxygenase